MLRNSIEQLADENWELTEEAEAFRAFAGWKFRQLAVRNRELEEKATGLESTVADLRNRNERLRMHGSDVLPSDRFEARSHSTYLALVRDNDDYLSHQDRVAQQHIRDFLGYKARRMTQDLTIPAYLSMMMTPEDRKNFHRMPPEGQRT
eukprot:CAMPEP_0197194482 /NCGR_PEP_ID=MMETSP1423-20130617/29302_1 /TAXON_ID=476441 /ORGANISM="Pseudo-nitzschia heimii, Strain UNC1101" /LENGTH=148 /DNA_ID=CAMNT_0042647909 /DNA_START=1 /DNA_END=444 /DNA_ORIENTATION=+